MPSPRSLVVGVPEASAQVRARSTQAASDPPAHSRSTAQQAPGPADQPQQVPAAFQEILDELGAWVKGKGGQLGAQVISLASGRVLAERSPHQPLNPASNAKLLTAGAALSILGPDYRFTTGAYGLLEGDSVGELVLRGHGDPSLRTEHLWEIVHALHALGLRKVVRLEVDATRFDSQFVPPAFGQQPNEWAAFRANVSAVSLERNAITLNVQPGSAGQLAQVWFDPPGFAELEGTVATKKAGAGQAVRLSLEPAGSRLRGRVGGHVAEGMERMRFTRRVDDPRLFAGYVFRELLRQAGVQVPAAVQLGGEGVKRRLAYVTSPPLRDLLGPVGKNSDNFYAETLLKALGAEVSNKPGSSASGAHAVTEWLRKLGTLEDGTRISNGSGLFDANRVTASTLVRTLRALHRDETLQPEYLSQLAIGGVDGTLHARFRDSALRGRVRGKTGTLAKVDALSGFFLAEEPAESFAFSLLVNGLRQHWATRPKLDEAVAATARLATR